MGNSYGNVTLRTADQNRVLAALRHSGHSAFVSAPMENSIVVFPSETTARNDRLLERLSADLTRTLQCASLAVLVHDDTASLYLLHDNGQLGDRYMSAPYYFQSGFR